MSNKIQWVLIAMLMVFALADAFSDWPAAIDANDYTGSHAFIYNDVNGLEVVLQGAITDTNISADAAIQGSKVDDSTLTWGKLQYGMLYMTAEQPESAKAIAYGNAKIVDADSAIFPDAHIVVPIVWDDSSEVGNPAFSATPRYINVSYYCAEDTICWQNETRYLSDHPAAPCFQIRNADAGSCSVFVYNPAAGDTLWTWKSRLLWEAIE